MRKIVLFLSAFLILTTSSSCSKRAYSQKEGLMLVDKYSHSSNKKRSKKARKQQKKRHKAYNKQRR